MDSHNQGANAAEHRLRGLGGQGRGDAIEALQRRKDLIELAKMPEGRRILSWLIASRDAPAFSPDAMQNAYLSGRTQMAAELARFLKSSLPRHLYIEIIYPEKES